MGKSIVLDKSKAFAVRVMRMSRYLRDNDKEWVITNQVSRSGISIGANISEALSAISYKEYLAKMYIALKECRETLYWLELLEKTRLITPEQYRSMQADCVEIYRMLSAITKTTRKRINNPPKDS